jgi:hypothetical protein
VELAHHPALGERGGRIDDEVVAAPDIERGLLEQEREADGEQHLAQRVEAQRSQEYALHGETERRDGERRRRQREQPGPGGPDHRQCHVAAKQEVGAVRQIHDAHDAEDQRQPAREQEQQRPVRHAVEDLDQPELRVQPPPLLVAILQAQNQGQTTFSL